MSNSRTIPITAKPPTAVVWVLLGGSAVAVLLTGTFATALVVGDPASLLRAAPSGFWVEMALAAALTVASLGIRSLRWIFLLRRVETRIPIRDAYIGYLAGLSLLLAPFLLGEVGIRAAVLRARGRVPIGTTILVNVWERILDLTAIGIIAGLCALSVGQGAWWTVLLLGGAAMLTIPMVRQQLIEGIVFATGPFARSYDPEWKPETKRLQMSLPWAVSLLASLAAWLLPGMAFWRLANASTASLGVLEAQRAYAEAAGFGGLVLAPGGVLVVGGSLIDSLLIAGAEGSAAALAVLGTRMATVGVATALGIVFVIVHLRSKAPSLSGHFDEIADAYDVQIPESRRDALLTRKTEMMREELVRAGVGSIGLDVGCGQGAYVGRMRELGFDVTGIDQSTGQIASANRKLGLHGIVRTGSVLDVPAADGTYDFVYIINVLHHLTSTEEQRRAFKELLRVLKPGGLLFVHEINTRNPLFRFYMGYVFPSLNCIDEGIERWLLAHKLDTYTDAPVIGVRYFTFLPDFMPQAIVRLFAPIERWLENSPIRSYSAHYMAILQKPGSTQPS